MSRIDRDLEEMEQIIIGIQKQYVKPMQDKALYLKKIGQLTATSLSGTEFASKNEEKVVEAATAILQILGYYDDYLVKELKKIRIQIERRDELTRNGRSC